MIKINGIYVPEANLGFIEEAKYSLKQGVWKLLFCTYNYVPKSCLTQKGNQNRIIIIISEAGVIFYRNT